MEGHAALKNDIAQFQSAVRKLSGAVKACGVDWQDAQLQELSASVKTIAASARQVAVAGNSYEIAMNRFQRIVSEV